MSMENAILELAAALREQAAAMREGNEVSRATAVGYERAVTAYAAGGEKLVGEKAAELALKQHERVVAALEAKAKDAKANASAVKPDAELEQAVSRVEDDATQTRSISRAEIEQAKADAAAEVNGDPDGLATLLDYAKDVRPVLLAAIKKAGKDKVQALINTFGVDKADKVDPAKHGELLAGAQKLAA